jgi:hypothetical protein
VDRALLGLLTVAATRAVGGAAAPAARGPAPTLPASAVAAIHLDPARADRLRAFRSRDGSDRAVWVAPTTDGQTCVLDVGADQVGAGCGPTLFGAHRLAFTEASAAAPPGGTAGELRIAGVAAPAVGSVAIDLSDGSTAVVVPDGAGAFVYELPETQLARGVMPVALRARDGTAKQVDRIDLPRQPLVR